MKPKYKLKGWVVVSVYLLSLGAILSSLFLLGKTLKASFYSEETLSYVYRGIIEDAVPVVNFNTDKIFKPFMVEDVTVLKHFYDKDADSSVQENALIFYQNTYMPNTGVLYGSTQKFDVVAVLDGTIMDVSNDEIMGNIVTIKHSNNLKTIYQSLGDVNVLVGDLVKQGDVIGTSGVNKIETTSENMLLFEVNNNGEYINPDTFYTINPEELS